jgi:anthranilate phosphoribosyltransferase
VRTLLDRLLDRESLTEAEAEDLLHHLATGGAPEALAGAVLAAIRAKGETADEVRGFARAMRALALAPDLGATDRAVDVVGTGGDGSHSLNLSTGGALLAAACGAPVVKHGNRSVSSRCGSADVLEALGLPMPLDASDARALLEATSFTFLFAPHYHPAMRVLAPVRRALGVRTVFNLLGPLVNPASPPHAVIGAASLEAASVMAETLSGMEIERVFVVHGAGGWDEPTPIGPFVLHDVRRGSVEVEERDPLDAGMPRCEPAALAGGTAEENAAGLLRALSGEPGAPRDALTLSAALALEVSGRASDLAEGLGRARDAVDSGKARALLGSIAEFGAVRRRTA